MSYYDDRRYGESRGRDRDGDRGYAADYYDEHPDSRRYSTRHDYGSRQTQRPGDFRRRASSVGGDSSYHRENRSQRRPSHQYDDSYSRQARHGSSSESGRSSRHRNRRKSTGGSSRSNGYHDQDRSRDQSSSDNNRDQGHSSFFREKGGELLMQAAVPLIAAGAAEALRARKQPGEWKGDKGKNVLSAAVTNGLINRDPSKPHHQHVMDTALPGLKEGAPTREERQAIQRRLDQARGSRTSSNLKKVAVAGAVAFAGKELYDRYGRSRSQGRGQGYSDDLYGSKKRSQSVSHDWDRGKDYRGHDEDYYQRHRGRDRYDQPNHWDSDSSRDRDYRDWDDHSDGYWDSDMENNYRDDDYGRQQGSRELVRSGSLNDYPQNSSHGDCSCSDCESDLGDSSDEREKAKKMKRDMLLTSGLATAATIHAAHKVYGSVNKRKKRMAQLEDGEITAEEARKARIKANTIDAASIGLAALGIKGAYGEWKEANEKRKETQSFQQECLRRGEQRQHKRNRRYA